MVENKNDPQFVLKLNELEQNALQSKRLIDLYEVLDILSGTQDSEERINNIYQNILEVALENLAGKLEQKNLFALDNEEELYTLRALYEYAINHYSNNDFKGASELFFMLNVLVEDSTIRFSMQLHAIGAAEHISFDEFVEKFIDLDALKDDEGAIFMDRYKEGVQEFVNAKTKTLKELYRLYHNKE